MDWITYESGIGVATAALAGIAGRAYFGPRSQLLWPVVWHGDRHQPARVALTFDDGPSPEFTPAILDALGELGVRAAFFVVGLNALQHPALIRRIDAEGHLLGNHTYHHPRWGLFRARHYWEREVGQLDDLLADQIGKRPAFFRPPMGFKNGFMAAGVRHRGQTMVTWTRRALDGLPTTADRILDRLVPPASAGDILALHDGVEPGTHRDQQPTIEALRPLVQRLRDRGLEPVRLDELIDRPAYMA